jgi:hypothetical protein
VKISGKRSRKFYALDAGRGDARKSLKMRRAAKFFQTVISFRAIAVDVLTDEMNFFNAFFAQT